MTCDAGSRTSNQMATPSHWGHASLDSDGEEVLPEAHYGTPDEFDGILRFTAVIDAR